MELEIKLPLRELLFTVYPQPKGRLEVIEK